MKDLIFFDTETTAKDNARLVQLAYAINDDPIICKLYKPAEPITIEAMEIHHITNEEVENLEPVNGLKGIVFIDKIAIAHNAKFDIGVLNREGVDVCDYIDTLRVSQHVLTDSPSHRLQYLRYALKLSPPESNLSAHDAAGDVAMLRELFRFLMVEVEKIYTATDNYNKEVDQRKTAIDKMIQLTKTSVLIPKMPFGKYKDMKFYDIKKLDAGYLKWLIKNAADLSDDLKYTINFHINN